MHGRSVASCVATENARRRCVGRTRVHTSHRPEQIMPKKRSQEQKEEEKLAAEEAANAPGYQRQLKREMRRRQNRSEVTTPSRPSADSLRPSYNRASPMTRHAATVGGTASGAPRRRLLAFQTAPPPAPAPICSPLMERPITSAAPVEELKGRSVPENMGATTATQDEDCILQ